MCSQAPHDSWSEAVVVTFDPDAMDLQTLIEVHLRTHASTSPHKMRGKYRSAVYSFDDRQARAASDALQNLQAGFSEPLVTRVLPHAGFRPSDRRFRDYYATDPDRPFCRTYINPKLRFIREAYSSLVLREG